MGFNAADFIPENTSDSDPTWGQVEDMAPVGDPPGRRVTATLLPGARMLARDVLVTRRTGENRDRREAQLVGRIRESEEAGRRNAKAALERERQLLEEIGRMRRLAEAGDKRQRFMVKLTLTSAVFAALSPLVAIVAIVAG